MSAFLAFFLSLFMTMNAYAIGKIAFYSLRDGNYEIYVMNADGTNQTRLTNNLYDDVLPAWSPDGSKIAFSSSRDGNLEIYVMNADGTNQTRLTNNPGHDVCPDWSPDGSKIAFSSHRDNNIGIYVMNADGTGQTRLTTVWGYDNAPVWSPDGSKIAFSRQTVADGNCEIYVMNADGTGQTRLTTAWGYDLYPEWSPDGSKIAFSSSRDGNYEIYVMNADGTNQTNLTNSLGDDNLPAWSPDSTKIAFFSDPGEIYVMNADGTGKTRLTYALYYNSGPDWTSGTDWVNIDIKPYSCPNPFKLPQDIVDLQGVLPVAILGTETLDVMCIDPASIKISRECDGCESVAPILWAYEDVATPFEGELCECHELGPDGYLDLKLKFRRKALAKKLNLYDVAGQTIPLTITGNLKEECGDTPIRGQDCVRIKVEKAK